MRGRGSTSIIAHLNIWHLDAIVFIFLVVHDYCLPGVSSWKSTAECALGKSSANSTSPKSQKIQSDEKAFFIVASAGFVEVAEVEVVEVWYSGSELRTWPLRNLSGFNLNLPQGLEPDRL